MHSTRKGAHEKDIFSLVKKSRGESSTLHRLSGRAVFGVLALLCGSRSSSPSDAATNARTSAKHTKHIFVVLIYLGIFVETFLTRNIHIKINVLLF